jgi:hypothetical protein
MKSPSAGMVLLISVFAISSALAQAGSSSQSSVLASGEVTKVDTSTGKNQHPTWSYRKLKHDGSWDRRISSQGADHAQRFEARRQSHLYCRSS